MLISAITRPEVLAPWLGPMARHGVPLAGICSPAMLTGAMLKAIGARGEHLLVVSLQSGGGLRQTCFRQGKLHFSRLAAMSVPAAAGNESHVLAEIERTRRYLGTLRPRSGDERLEVHVLSHGTPLEALRRELRRDAGDELRAGYRVVDLATVARGLGMRRWAGEPTADRLFVHLLAGQPPGNHYAMPGPDAGLRDAAGPLVPEGGKRRAGRGRLPLRRDLRSRRGCRTRSCAIPRAAGGAS